MHPKDIMFCKLHGSADDVQYDQWQPEYGIDNFVKTEFTCGACYHLAYAIHQATNWPIYSVSDDHYFVVNNEGKAVDIYGVRPTEKAPTKYDYNMKENQFPSLIENIEDVSHDEHYLWAKILIKHFPEHFGI